MTFIKMLYQSVQAPNALSALASFATPNTVANPLLSLLGLGAGAAAAPTVLPTLNLPQSNPPNIQNATSILQGLDANLLSLLMQSQAGRNMVAPSGPTPSAQPQTPNHAPSYPPYQVSIPV
jgi:hypothetical protein